jgi:hypothetical protein
VLLALLASAGRERFRLHLGCSIGREVFACVGDRCGGGVAAA